MIQRAIPGDSNAAVERFIELYIAGWGDRDRTSNPVLALVEWLRSENIQVGVVTGGGQRRAELTLELLGLRQIIDSVAGGSPERSNKQEGLRKMADTWGLEPARLAYLGDSQFDVRDALAVGAHPIGAAWYPGGDPPEVLVGAGAEQIFTDAADLREWLSSDG